MIAEPDHPTPYELVGGKEKVPAIIERFYGLMDLGLVGNLHKTADWMRNRPE